MLFYKDPLDTHQGTWQTYKSLCPESIDLGRLDNFDTESRDLIDDRNRENYSFEGYDQIDFNLASQSYPAYFNRDEIKETNVYIYDTILGDVLSNFQKIFHLINDFNINQMPLELDKFEYMINYMIDESEVREKLIDLCRRNFPLENEYQWEINEYYSR